MLTAIKIQINFKSQRSNMQNLQKVNNLILNFVWHIYSYKILFVVLSMYFSPNSLIEVQLLPNYRMVAIDNKWLYFGAADLSTTPIKIDLIQKKPIKTYYADETSQVLVRTQTSIEIYYSDWINTIQLRKILLLNSQETLFSAKYMDSKWHLFGTIFQYSDQQVQIIKIWETHKPCCFVGNYQFFIENRSLYRVTHSANLTKREQIKWKQKLMVTANCKDNLTLAGMQNTQNVVLCLGQTYTLLLAGSKVIKTLERNHVFYFQNEMIISGLRDCRVDRVRASTIEDLGVTQTASGDIYAAAIFQDQMIFMQLNGTKLQPKVFKLIVTELSDKKTLHISFDSFHKAIPEQANESGSMLISNPRDLRSSNKNIEKNQEIDQQQRQGDSDHSGGSLTGKKKYQNNILFVQEEEDVLELDDLPPIKMISSLHQHSKQGQDHKSKNDKKQGKQAQVPYFEDVSQIDFLQGDTWAEFMTKMRTEQGIAGSFIKQNKKQSLTEVLAGSEKVQAFALGRIITPQLRKYIQLKSYSYLMMECQKFQPKQFDGLLKRFLKKIIEEQEQAGMLFSEHIRLFNPQNTKQRLNELYGLLEDTVENKNKFCKVLLDFKLNEVPKRCFNIDEGVINILLTFNPDLFLVDLLQPSSKLFEDILEQYMINDQLQVEQVQVQDEFIDITHPRNVLNVLLFLNDTFQIPIFDVFKAFITKTLKYGHVQIVKNLIEKQNVLQLCGIQNESVYAVIQQFIFNIIRESCSNLSYAYQIIRIFEGQRRKKMELNFQVFTYLSKLDLIYSMDKFHKIIQAKRISPFVIDIIKENFPKNLFNLNLPILYRKIYEIIEDKILSVYNYELVYLLQFLSQKLMEEGYILKALAILDPASMVVSRGFLAKLLIKYMDGKLFKNLLNVIFSQTVSIKTIFASLFENYRQFYKEKLPVQNIVDEPIPETDKSPAFKCNYSKYSGEYEHFVFSCEEIVVKSALFLDPALGVQLVRYGILQHGQFAAFVVQMMRFLTVSIPQKKQHQPPNVETSIMLLETQHGDSPQQTSNNQQGILLQNQNGTRKITQSLTNILRADDPNDSRGAKSVCKQDSLMNDQQLQYLHISVQKQPILSTLRQIYESQDRRKFLKGLSMVEDKNISLYNTEIYKTMVELCLNNDQILDQLIPFEFFLAQQPVLIFDEHSYKNKILSLMTFNNFWAIYTIIDCLMLKGQQCIEMLLEKIIVNEKNDSQTAAKIVQFLVNKFTLKNKFIGQMKIMARKNNLTNISKKLQGPTLRI